MNRFPLNIVLVICIIGIFAVALVLDLDDSKVQGIPGPGGMIIDVTSPRPEEVVSTYNNKCDTNLVKKMRDVFYQVEELSSKMIRGKTILREIEKTYASWVVSVNDHKYTVYFFSNGDVSLYDCLDGRPYTPSLDNFYEFNSHGQVMTGDGFQLNLAMKNILACYIPREDFLSGYIYLYKKIKKIKYLQNSKKSYILKTNSQIFLFFNNHRKNMSHHKLSSVAEAGLKDIKQRHFNPLLGFFLCFSFIILIPIIRLSLF